MFAVSVEKSLKAKGDARRMPPSKRNITNMTHGSTGALPVHGLSALTRPIFQASDYSHLTDPLYARIEADSRDAAAVLDLATLHQLLGLQKEGVALQREALRFARHFSVLAPCSWSQPLKVLLLLQPGTFHDNTPVEFLIEQHPVQLELLYLMPDAPLPATVPEHDILFVGIGYSEPSKMLLERLVPWLAHWPRPVVNRPEAILNSARDVLVQKMLGADGVLVAAIGRFERSALLALAAGTVSLESLLPGVSFPVLVRPVDSHAGNALEKIDTVAGIAAYLDRVAENAFFVTEFIDYRDADGLFWKRRIVQVDGRPFLAHTAMNDHWMIHYLNAGMRDDSAKRAMEADDMATFEQGFAKRHAAAFAEIYARLGLDYLLMDCSETPDGRLFVFEADPIMIVHDMDPVDIYPYKKPVMAAIFEAFYQSLQRRMPTDVLAERRTA